MSTGTKISAQLARAAAAELCALLEISCLKLEVAGSIRRGCPEVSDIELVAVPKVEQVPCPPGEDLFASGQLVDVNLLHRKLDIIVPRYLKAGQKYRAFMWPLKDGGRQVGEIQVDLSMAPWDFYGLILAIRTGSAGFCRHLMASLGRQSLRSDGGKIYHRVGNEPFDEPIATPTEVDVFRLADLKWIPPSERNWD